MIWFLGSELLSFVFCDVGTVGFDDFIPLTSSKNRSDFSSNLWAGDYAVFIKRIAPR